MAGGAGALGFGGGIAKGLARVFGQHREQTREDTRRKEDQDFRADSAILPVLLQHAQETGDYSRAEEVLYRWHPDLEKRFKKEGSPFQALGPLLANPALQAQSSPPVGTTSQAFEQEPPPPITPTRVAGVPPEPPKTFLGMPVLSQEQRLAREDQSTDTAAKIRLARKLASEGMPLGEAFDRVGLREFASGSASTIRYGGTVSGADLPDGTLDSFGRPKANDDFYRVENLPNGTKQYVPTTTPGMVSAGTDIERAAQSMGFRRFADVPPEQRATVEKKAKDLAAQFAGGATTARAEASAKAPLSTKQRFDALTELQTQWRKIDAPKREMERQFKLMQTGLARFDADPVGGSEAIRVTFEKMLDPTSVVRESEYARQGEGLSLLQRLEGYKQKLISGGGNIPKAELAAMVDTAQQLLAGMEGWNDLEKGRIDEAAKEAGLDPKRVYGVASAATKKEDGAKSSVPLPDGFEMRDGRLVIKKP